MSGIIIFGALFDVIKDVVDGFFRVVSSDGAFDICEELGIMFSGLEVQHISTSVPEYPDLVV